MFDRSRMSPDDGMYEHVEDINRAIADVRSGLKREIKLDNSKVNLTVFVDAQRYLQAHIRRALMFLDGGKHALDGGYSLVALTCARSIYESAACIYDFCERFFLLTAAKDFEGAARLTYERSLAIKFDEFRPVMNQLNLKPQSILTYIDRLSDEVPGARRAYEQLSEAVHPNAFGALLYFEAVDDDGIARYADNPDVIDTYGLLVTSASLFSLIRSEMFGFLAAHARMIADEMQDRIDDYERRKAAGLTSG